MVNVLRKPEDVSGHFYTPTMGAPRPCKLLSVDEKTQTARIQPSAYADGKYTIVTADILYCSCQIENVGKSRSGDRWKLKDE